MRRTSCHLVLAMALTEKVFKEKQILSLALSYDACSDGTARFFLPLKDLPSDDPKVPRF